MICACMLSICIYIYDICMLYCMCIYVYIYIHITESISCIIAWLKRYGWIYRSIKPSNILSHPEMVVENASFFGPGVDWWANLRWSFWMLGWIVRDIQMCPEIRLKCHVYWSLLKFIVKFFAKMKLLPLKIGEAVWNSPCFWSTKGHRTVFFGLPGGADKPTCPQSFNRSREFPSFT